MERKTIGILWLSLFVAIAIALYIYLRAITVSAEDVPRGENGTFDFTEFDLSSVSYLKLLGDVEFYWDTLLSPDDFKNEKQHAGALVFIPSKWNSYEVNEKKVGPMGFATYRFVVKVPNDDWYGLKIKEFESAYKIWVNGKLLGEEGVVASTKTKMKPSRKRREFYFQSENKQVEVVLQIANFQHRKGGATKFIFFGKANGLIKYKNMVSGTNYFLLGILFILFLYHLVLFLFQKKDRSVIYFSLLCLAMLLRHGLTDEKILLEIFPWLSYEIAMRIEYFSFMAIAPFMAHFVRALLPHEVSLKFVQWLTGITIAFIVFVLLTPVLWFSYTPLVFQFLIIIPIVYFLIVLFISVLRKREFAVAIYGGVFFFYIFVVNDFLYYNNRIIETSFLMPFGIFVLAISQAFVLSKRRAKAFAKADKMSSELKVSNLMLEDRVVQRTQKISEQKDEIESQKLDLEYKNNELQSLARFKKDMTHMMVHDLKNPLSNIIGFSEEEEMYREYREYVLGSGWQLHNMVHNILDVEKYESTKIQLNTTTVRLSEVVDKAFESNRFLISLKEIQFENLISPEHEVLVDKDIIVRVFANIFSNAAKYGKSEGIIRAHSQKVNENGKSFIKVEIYNSGEPIPAKHLEEIFDKYKQLHTVKESFAFSTGIGLAFCKMAVNAHGGTINAISGSEKGATFTITLPV